MNCRTVIVTGIILAGTCSTLVNADTLMLRDGRRVQGRLVSVRDDVVEFESQRGGPFGSRERLRLGLDDVIRIEFDDRDGRDDRDDRFSRDRDRDRGSAVGGGRRPGLRERDVRVNAREAWTDTGIDVRAGQTLYFSASGRVRWGPGRQDGPEGERNSPRNDARPIPSRPAAALIGRIGNGADYFYIGDATEGIRVRDSGTLYLGLNDDYLQDNSGSFTVTVGY